tara:strand:+ start:3118 stop:3441 length:324 start_codon:yes stop_codon:yes gene_type:complete
MEDKIRFIKRAMNHSYLSSDLETLAETDGCKIEDYTMTQLVDEAFYCLTTYDEPGHINNPDEYDPHLRLENGICEHKQLKREKSQLARLFRDFAKYHSGNKFGMTSK